VAKKHGVTLIQFGIVWRRELQINSATQRREHVGNGHTGFGARCNRLNGDLGMLRE